MSIFSWFGGSSDEPWRKLVARERVEALDEDTGELIDIRPRQDDPNDVEGILIRMGYTDAGANVSRRVLLCHRAWISRGTIYVRGYCTMREALRTFRPDRMFDAEEIRTRRPISDPETYFFRFAEDEDAAREERYRREREAEAAEYAARREVLSLCRDGLRVLAYVALADGSKADGERSVMQGFVRSRLKGRKLADGRDALGLESEAVSFGESLAPSKQSFSMAVRKIAGDESYLRSVFGHAVELAKADGHADPAEVEAVKAIVVAVEKARGIKPPR